MFPAFSYGGLWVIVHFSAQGQELFAISCNALWIDSALGRVSRSGSIPSSGRKYFRFEVFSNFLDILNYCVCHIICTYLQWLFDYQLEKTLVRPSFNRIVMPESLRSSLASHIAAIRRCCGYKSCNSDSCIYIHWIMFNNLWKTAGKLFSSQMAHAFAIRSRARPSPEVHFCVRSLKWSISIARGGSDCVPRVTPHGWNSNGTDAAILLAGLRLS